ncbi:nitronate monooxygenase [Psychrobacter pacificensis]|uniref:Propionate 3-nitronate monooxygenase n=1 Tax=Psychrobacter pacificensis TaxID=112002 RepID=A0A1G6Y960_9GAMM|nr:nitronate monooxygenase [Psychrobacter pacificensis]GLR27933.1 nitronate monooxygenase [Psychrobacter pacificensis]SDD86959.1 nitronate monooxygenase [Psychrobacter pacificensis]
MSLLNTLNLTYPIVQAPMAGATTPELALTVSDFGGLGSLGAGTTSPEVLNEQINTIKSRTDRPFMINLMVLSEHESNTFTSDIPAWLDEYYQKNQIDTSLPERPALRFADQLQVLYDNPVPVASFTFGIISAEQVQHLQSLGTRVVGTANHPHEAKAWADIGADAVCVQGVEAGGHRGGWLPQSANDPMGLLTLIGQTRACTDIPMIAAGGIMTGQDIKAVQAAGAELAQMGTAFLTTDQCGINDTYKQALIDASQGLRSTETRLTRLFSDKLARGLLNNYLRDFAQFECADTLPPYPQLNAMTKFMRADAAKRLDAEHLSLWAGQGVTLVKNESTDALLTRLIKGL